MASKSSRIMLDVLTWTNINTSGYTRYADRRRIKLKVERENPKALQRTTHVNLRQVPAVQVSCTRQFHLQHGGLWDHRRPRLRYRLDGLVARHEILAPLHPVTMTTTTTTTTTQSSLQPYPQYYYYIYSKNYYNTVLSTAEQSQMHSNVNIWNKWVFIIA